MESVIAVLAREHVIVLRMLDQLELALGARDWGTLGRAMTFLTTQLPVHRSKEEAVLFPALRKVCNGCTPISTFMDEHSDETFHMEVLSRAIELKNEDALERHGRAFLAHLRHHIWREEHALFPMIDALLDDAMKKDVQESFALLGDMPPAPTLIGG